MDPQVAAYLQQRRSAGLTDSQIKQELLSAGWNQAQVNQVFGNIPMPPIGGEVPAPTQNYNSSNNFFDERTVASMKWTFVALIIARAIDFAVDMFASPAIGFSPYFSYSSIRMATLIGGIVSSAVGAFLGGIILSKLWDTFWYTWIRRIFNGWFDSIFKLYFWGGMIGLAIGFLLGGAAGMSLLGGYFGASFMTYWAIYFAASIVGMFIGAKILDANINKYYFPARGY